MERSNSTSQMYATRISPMKTNPIETSEDMEANLQGHPMLDAEGRP